KRQGDIMSLIHHYLHEYNQDFGKKFIGLTDNTQNILSNYHWPGNIRELQNILSQIVTLNHGKYITTDMLPETLHSFETSDIVNDQEHSPVPVMSIPLWQIEKNAIEHMIEFCNGNIVQAAAILDIAPSTIYRKLQGWKKK
ncbi:MAG: sigma-54-dependent Fis family transcriptional regulator, partial [Alphaproteobacteria bacterium]|nr:sigma-54-dependent Fis family transcriptional regulator [Alphaproteobacteria bacterium]